MSANTILSDEDFLSAFNDCSAPPSAFNHEGHVRIAWIHLQRYPLAQAIRLTCDGIERFANHLGAPDKYNRTLSEALMRIMASLGAADTRLSWDGYLSKNRELIEDAQQLLGRYYSNELLTSKAARTTFMQPDISPLP